VFQNKSGLSEGTPIKDTTNRTCGIRRTEGIGSASTTATAWPWGPRALHITLVFRDQIWVMGGQTLPQFAPHEERFYRDIWRSSDGCVRWEQVLPHEPFWPQRGMIAGSAVLNGRMWLLGGGTYDTARASGTIVLQRRLELSGRH